MQNNKPNNSAAKICHMPISVPQSSPPHFVSEETECVQVSKKKRTRCFFGKDLAARKTTKLGYETPSKINLRRKDLIMYDSKDDDRVVWRSKENKQKTNYKMAADNNITVNEIKNGRKLFDDESGSHGKDVPESQSYVITQQE
jgi:hypothetical protein